VAIDFFEKDHPVIRPVQFDFDTCGHALCIMDTGADHADLTQEYAAVPGEMRAVAAYFGKEVLSQVEETAFLAAMPQLRQTCGDRAVLRALHFYKENARVWQQVEALEQGDFGRFLSLVKESGRSSYMYLQNVTPSGSQAHQAVALTLAMCAHYLRGRGAYRVHGGGFAGTVQAFVPYDMLEDFRAGIEAVLGTGSCHVLRIRPQGGVPCEE
jgi:galactokinase